MIKLLAITSITVLTLCPGNLFSQCTVAISGTPCLFSPLVANIQSSNFDTLKWAINGSVQMVKTKRNPYGVIAAGGGSSNSQQLFGVQDVFVDEQNNLYIVEDNRQRVQKWAAGADSGVTVAGGNGKGTALNQFFSPKGIVVDKSGNVYVSDALMSRITKWAPGATSGVVVAGGNGEGSAANQLNGNQNFCMDKDGNIYIADRWNDRIQKWAPGAVTGVTVAGGNGEGSALNQLAEPLDVDVDTLGNIYVVDYHNDRVVKWAPGATSGVVVAGGNGKGSAANQLYFTTALSISPDGSLFVRDQNNYRIQKWKPGASYGVTVAGGNGFGGGSHRIAPGFGLFVDGQENVFVPQLFINLVHKFTPSNTVDTLFTPLAKGSYKVYGKGSNGCYAQSSIFNVFTQPVKPPYISGPNQVSSGQQGIVYKVKPTVGSTYTWSVPSDAVITSGQGTKEIMVNWGSSDGGVSVVVSNACGSAPAKTRNVYITNSIVSNSNNKTITNAPAFKIIF